VKFCVIRLVVLALGFAALSGCRFKEPPPSESVYLTAVEEVPKRPQNHLVTEKTVVTTAIEVTIGAFDRLLKSGQVAYRPPGDLYVAAPSGAFGALAGDCRTLNALGVAFPCTDADVGRVASRVRQAKASQATGQGKTEAGQADWLALAGPIAGATAIVTIAERQGLCAPSTGGPESAGKPGGIGDVIRTLSDLADQRQAKTDDTAGVVLNQVSGGWSVCLVLLKPVLGAVPIKGGDFARVWHRGPYAGAQSRRQAAAKAATAAKRNVGNLLRITLFHDPESMAAIDLTSLVDVLLQ
jgi:hypothetical protein